MKFLFKRVLATVVLASVYLFATLLSVVLKVFIKRKKQANRVIINGTFFNPNWFHAHITPICLANYGEVILVSDEPVERVENLTYYCPPSWAASIFSRAGAKLLWTILAGIKWPADVFIGYHIFPSAITALIAARLTGGKAVYQVTSGPLELAGGGWNAENKLLTSLGKPSALIEKLVNVVMGQFDMVVVRGSSAQRYVREGGFKNKLEIVTGSVLTDAQLMAAQRDVDVIFVGRLTEAKRPDRFLNILAKVVGQRADLKAYVAGDGPDMPVLQDSAKELGIAENVTFLGKISDVPQLMGRSKLFLLTSRWEGVSIAMLEAMALKVVPVVVDVGDLSDFVTSAETGYIIAQDNLDEFANVIIQLLEDDALRERIGGNARAKVMETSDRQALAKRWFKLINELGSHTQ